MINSSYQKQGTYQCQVREFGSFKTVISNSVLLTYNRVYNGIVTLWPINQLIDADSIMTSMTNSINELSKVS